MTRPLRIGNAQAFWGDRAQAAAEMLARVPDIDFLTLDYLAEVSMSILARQRDQDAALGYARDFVDVVRSLAPYWTAGGRCRLITNAGGLNPGGCAGACSAALEEAGCRPMRLGVVAGDDVLAQLCSDSPESSSSRAFRNLDSAEEIATVRDRLITANAYLGAGPVVESLAADAELVVTGRVADPSLTVAACIDHFGWAVDDFDRLAGATVAGHLIECGTQVTGGISTDWLELPDLERVGFPVVEVFEDGSCMVTKPPGTGGRVSEWTVKEQLVYEIADPGNYLSPDVTASFCELVVEELGNDRVRVSGARGRPPPATYKVSATYRDGFRAAGTLTIFGRQAEAKARRCGEMVLNRVRSAGCRLRDSLIECLGAGDCVPGIAGQLTAPGGGPERIETVLRVAVEADAYEAVERFARELMPMITAGPPGTTGYAEGRPIVRPVFRYWPCLIDRALVAPRVDVQLSGAKPAAEHALAVAPGSDVPIVSPAIDGSPPPAEIAAAASAGSSEGSGKPVAVLQDLAYARSGDKGINANIGVIVRRSQSWMLLEEWLTAERVAAFFESLQPDSVERFELPKLGALNFLLRGVLRRGLRSDAQGKALGAALLQMPLPAELAATIARD